MIETLDGSNGAYVALGIGALNQSGHPVHGLWRTLSERAGEPALKRRLSEFRHSPILKLLNPLLPDRLNGGIGSRTRMGDDQGCHSRLIRKGNRLRDHATEREAHKGRL